MKRAFIEGREPEDTREATEVALGNHLEVQGDVNIKDFADSSVYILINNVYSEGFSMATSSTVLRRGSTKAARNENSAHEKAKPELQQKHLTWSTAFVALLICRYMSSKWNIIHDCDEVFNYWEPLHYLLYKSGFQTWEYRSVAGPCEVGVERFC